jgi:hypothetical protein
MPGIMDFPARKSVVFLTFPCMRIILRRMLHAAVSLLHAAVRPAPAMTAHNTSGDMKKENVSCVV